MANYTGTAGNDTITGGADADVINGNGGNDSLLGGDGADTVSGGAGNDYVSGNGGADWVEGGTGNDEVRGGSGQDSIAFHEFGAANADILSDFDAGWDNIQLDAAAFTQIGATGRMAAGDVRFYSAAGATGGHDADDRIVYNSTTGQLYYDADGNGAGAAQLIATISNHSALSATDLWVFGTPSPTPTPTPTPGVINGTDGNDSLTGTAAGETINGAGGNDTIAGAGGNDVLNGGGGDDVFRMGDPTPGNDTIDGGAGLDTLDYSDEHSNVNADFEEVGITGGGDGGSGSARIANVENFIGGAFADRVVGNAVANVLDGAAGNDFLQGGGGNDTLTGGSGSDTFYYAEAGGANADVITDFTSGTDQLRFNEFALTHVGGNGPFSAGDARFYAAPGATSGHDADDRIIYNTTSGQVFYDEDGNGSTAAQLVATLQGAPALSATDISVDGPTNPVGPVPASSDADVNSLLFGTKWGNEGLGTGATLTFSFRTADSVYSTSAYGPNSEPFTPGWHEMSDFTKDAIRSALHEWGDVANLNFVEVTDSATTSGTLRFGFTTYDNPGAEAWANYPGTGDQAGDVWFRDSLDNSYWSNAAPGNWGYRNFLHEIGHALGLTHPTSGINPAHDNPQYSVMSGKEIAGSSDSIYYIPMTPMLADVAAVQYMYGADMSTNAGDDVYHWASGEHIYATLWDAGGDDTIDWSNQGAALIDLNAGHYSYVGPGSPYTGFQQLVIDYGATIENAVGGAGNDTLIGNAVANVLTGGAGNDAFVFGSAPGGTNTDRITDFASGADQLHLDARAMTALGANGAFSTGDARFYAAAGATGGHDADDRVVFNTSTGQLFYDADGSAAGAAQLMLTVQAGANVTATDIVVDNGSTPTPSPTPTPVPAGSIVGTSGNDNLQGTTGVDSMYGLAGNDTIYANSGNDWIQGGTGNDSVSGGSGQDSYAFAEFGAQNADIVTSFDSTWDNLQLDAAGFTAIGATGRFSAGDVRFYAAAGATGGHDADDRIVYNTSTGQLFYDADGNGAGSAQLIATLQTHPSIVANDIYVFGTPSPTPTPSASPTEGNDSLTGTSGADTIDGLGGDDTINGLAGNDSLIGGAGADVLSGDDGNDTLAGGEGSDTLDGGLGDDTYIDPMSDTIVDAGGIDTVIVLSASGFNFPDSAENLIIRGPAQSVDPSAVGNALDNRITVETSDASYWIDGKGGNDTIIGGGGGDRISAHVSASSQLGHDVIDGGAGNDVLLVDSDASGALIDFQHGTLTSRSGTDGSGASFTNVERAWGSQYDDVLIASDAGSELHGQYGNDTVLGGAGADLLDGDGFFDAPAEPIGNDSVVGGGGNDTLVGGHGNDTLDGGTGNDRLTGGNDNDVFRFSASPGAANADTISDFLSGTDRLQLDAGVMTALGGSGSFAAGDVRFYAAAGAAGGHDADDRVVYDSSSGNLWYDADGSGSGVAQLIATLNGAPGLAASDLDVINGTPTPTPTPALGQNITGTNNADTLVGGSGNDTIWGSGGNDWLEGRGGNDQLSGGSGQDSYVFREFGAQNADTIANFDSGWDFLRFDGSAFSGLGGAGHFSANDARFYAAAGATGGHDADDRMVFNTSTGQLYYDADGAGGADAQLVATVPSGSGVAAGDIWVV